MSCQLQRVPDNAIQIGLVAIMQAQLCEVPIAYYKKFWILVEVVEIRHVDGKVRVVPLGGPIADGSYEPLVVCSESGVGYPLYWQRTNGEGLKPLP